MVSERGHEEEAAGKPSSRLSRVVRQREGALPTIDSAGPKVF